MPDGRGSMGGARGWRDAAPLVGPAVAYLAVFFLAPVAIVAAYSVAAPAPGGGFTLTLEHFRRALDPLYLAVLGRSVGLAFLTTAAALALGYPAALAVRGLDRRWRVPVLALLVVPSWMNLLVKNYAWIVILRREGVLNKLLVGAGVVDGPLPLLFNSGAVLMGLVHTYLPFMVLPLYAALERLDWRLVEAARDLGAGGWQAFRRVVLPGTLAGAFAGSVLVFIPALGAFVTPDLLGGTGSLMVGTLIENQILQVRDWPFASALAVWLMLLVVGAVAVYRRAAPAAGGEPTP